MSEKIQARTDDRFGIICGDKKGLILGTRGKGNVPKNGTKKWCREGWDERDGGQLIQLAKDNGRENMVSIGVRRWTVV